MLVLIKLNMVIKIIIFMGIIVLYYFNGVFGIGFKFFNFFLCLVILLVLEEILFVVLVCCLVFNMGLKFFFK